MNDHVMISILRFHRHAPHEDAQRTIVPWQAGVKWRQAALLSLRPHGPVACLFQALPGLAEHL